MKNKCKKTKERKTTENGRGKEKAGGQGRWTK